MTLVPMPLERLEGVRLGLPHVNLGEWPTAIERIELPDIPGEIWVKREDQTSPIYGGNKVRKLELLLAGSSGPVITIGAAGSHHVLATALHARALGRDCIAVLVPQTLTDHARTVRALNLEACAEVVRLDRVPQSLAHEGRSVASIVLELARSRSAATIVPLGGSSPTGILGYVNAGLEIAGQVAAGDCPRPDAIYTALGTGGTAAGLALGLALAGLETEIVAVRVASRLVGNDRYLSLLAQRTHRLLQRQGYRGPMPPLHVRVVHDAIGKGYGRPTPAGARAVGLAATVGLPCETTYTGKTLAVMLSEIAADSGRAVRMFLDTYGPIDDLVEPREQAGEPDR
ncbi:MAG: pyridoxal-phosphate dependent enzyme [Deltaproteobacteria bacterium]|nr:pyridoxal-phosphate dependent enzyme [Deltaproteobacteria bacterium]